MLLSMLAGCQAVDYVSNVGKRGTSLMIVTKSHRWLQDVIGVSLYYRGCLAYSAQQNAPNIPEDEHR